MKKILLLALIILTGCGNITHQKDPLKYKGCVIDNKGSINNYYQLNLKLNDSLRAIYKHDYIVIEVSKREYGLFNVGDTIK